MKYILLLLFSITCFAQDSTTITITSSAVAPIGCPEEPVLLGHQITLFQAFSCADTILANTYVPLSSYNMHADSSEFTFVNPVGYECFIIAFQSQFDCCGFTVNLSPEFQDIYCLCEEPPIADFAFGDECTAGGGERKTFIPGLQINGGGTQLDDDSNGSGK